jgi:hypothetical protein
MVSVNSNVRDGDSKAVGRTRAFLARPWMFTMLLVSGLCVAYLFGIIANWGNASGRLLFANLGLLPVGLTATFIAWKAAEVQSDRRSMRAWRLMAIGFAGFFVGDTLFFVYQNLLGITPFPSWADAGYLVYYPFMLAGLLSFPNAIRGRLERLAFYLDSAIVFIGGGMVVAYFFLIPTLDSAGGGVLEYSLSVGYPFGDLLLLAGLAYLVFRSRGRGSRVSLLLLSAGLLMGMFADVVYGWENIRATSAVGGLSDVAYMWSWGLFAWAGYAALTRTPRTEGVARGRGPNWLGLLLPATFSALALVLLVYAMRESHSAEDDFVIVAAVVLFGTLIARRVLDGIQTARLRAELAAARTEGAVCDTEPRHGGET